MKFLADIPIGRATIEFLRSKGHDAMSVRDLLPATAPDVEIVATAARDGRIVVCFDLDFSALVSQSGKSVPSVITLRLSKRHALAVNFALGTCLESVEDDLITGALVTVEDRRVRVRKLPVK